MLAEHDVKADRRDYFKDPFTADELRGILADAGISAEDIVSKRSRAYSELDLESRDVSNNELIELMVEHPTLIRRPLIVSGAGSVVGFKKAEIEKLIES